MTLSKSQIVSLLSLSILTGFWLAQWGHQPFLCLFLSLIGGVIASLWKSVIIWCFSLLALACGYAQMHNTPQISALKPFENKVIHATGWIEKFPEKKHTTQNLWVHITHIDGHRVSEKILVKTDKNAAFDYGDLLEIKGSIKRPRAFNDFDYPAYLARFDVHYTMTNPTLKKRTGSAGNWFVQTAYNVRKKLTQNLDQALPDPHQIIAMGVLLGVKQTLPKDLETDFKQAGLQHLLVVSGTNVTLFLWIVGLFLKPLGRNTRLLLSLIALVFFVSLTGAEAPVLRAAFLGGIIQILLRLGRLIHIRNIVLWAGVLMGLLQPEMLQNDVSAALSFAATFGIILGVPILWPYTSWIPGKYGFRLIICATCAAQIGVFPVLTYHFGGFPLSGFLSNVIVEPFMVLVMASSFVTSLLAWGPEWWNQIIGLPAFILIEAMIVLAQFFGSFGVLETTKTISLVSGLALYGFYLWALLSRTYETRFLQPFEKKLN